MNNLASLSSPAAAAGVRSWAVGWVAVFFLLLPCVGHALEARVSFGHANTYAAGAWTPVRITLENLPEEPGAGRDFRGHVEVRTSDYRGASMKHRQEIELPLHSRKLVEFEVMLSPNSPLVVELVDENAGPQIRKEVHPPRSSNAFASLRHSIYVVPTVLVLQSPTETFTLPFALDPAAANIKTVNAGELPRDYRGFDGVRLVVVQGRLSERLRPDQLDALDQWLLLGGRLAVVTPRHHQEIRDDPWLVERLPAAPAGVFELTLDDLAPGAGESPVLLTRWEAPPSGDSVLWRTQAGPAALVVRHGAGAVHALGVDPSGFGPMEMDTPVGRSVRALLDVWVLGAGREDLRARHLWSTADVDPAFEDVMLLPNLWVVTMLIVLFVVVVGPLNFLILRRRRQLELAWATIPGLSILFFAAVYAYGAAAKGGDQHFASSDILHLAPGSSEAFLLTSQIQFAPRKTTYELTPPEGGVVVPLHQYYHDPVNVNAFNLGNAFGYSALNAPGGDVGSIMPTLVQEESGRTKLLRPVEQWTMQFYQGEAPWSLEGSVNGSVHLRPGKSVDLNFRNDTGMDLRDAVLYLGDDRYPVGAIGAGETVDRTLAPAGAIPVSPPKNFANSGAPGQFSTSADFLIRHGGARVYPHFALQNPQRRARLVATDPAWKNPVEVQPAPDAEKAYGLVEVALPVTWEGDLSLTTADRLRREVYSVDSLNTQIDHNANSTFCRLRDSAVDVLIGNPWEHTRADFQKGQLTVSFVAHSEDLVISAFDYGIGKWTPVYESARVRNVTQNAPTLENLPIEPEWVNPLEPMVRLRLSAHPKPASAGAGGPGSMFSGNQGVEIISIDASMTLRQGGADLPAAPVRESVNPQEGILSL